MNSKKIYLFLLFVFFSTVFGNAQTSGFYWDHLTKKSNRIEGKLIGESFYISTEASKCHFLSNGPHVGRITLTDNDVIENVRIRYLAFGDELISYNERMPYFFTKVDKEVVREFAFDEEVENGRTIERRFVKLFYDGLIDKNKYFEVIYSGTLDVLAFHQMNREKTSPFIDEWGARRDYKYAIRTNYFLHSESSEFTKLLSKKKRSLLKGFPGNKKEIKRTFRKNRKSLQDIEAMKQAFILIDEAGRLK